MVFPNIQVILMNLATTLPQFVQMVTAFAYVMGIWFTFRALYKLKQYGELRTMMSSNTDLREPILLLMVGAMMLLLPSTIQYAETTVFNYYYAEPLMYPTQQESPWGMLQTVLVQFVRFFGLIAFIRGWMIVSGLGGQGNPNATIGKAITHIVAGVCAMNFEGTLHVLSSTLGIFF